MAALTKPQRALLECAARSANGETNVHGAQHATARALVRLSCGSLVESGRVYWSGGGSSHMPGRFWINARGYDLVARQRGGG